MIAIRDDVAALGLLGEFAAVTEAGVDEFSLAENLSLWAQMVDEIERGALWIDEELDAACHYRDDVDRDICRLPPGEARRRVVDFTDHLDRRFLACVVFNRTAPAESPGDGWWWRTTPRRTDQRAYLDDDRDWIRDPREQSTD